MTLGGIILCGGKSSRMGAPKALLPFGPETMLERVIRLLSAAARPIVVVAAPGQVLPPLSPDVILTHDAREGCGPLEGMLAGFRALPADTTTAYVTACDAPFLEPAFVRRMAELLGDHQAATLEIDGFRQPLSAVYRTAVLSVVERAIADGRMSTARLFDELTTRIVRPEEVRDVDPRLSTLRNVNEPADYLSALAEAGFEPTDKMRQRFS